MTNRLSTLVLSGIAATAAVFFSASPNVGSQTLHAPVNQASETPAATAASTMNAANTPDAANRTVFLIIMENHNWSDIHGSASAPYINNTLLTIGAHAEQYNNIPNLHPSEPNYLWLEAGSSFGVTNDSLPKKNHQSSTAHLTTLLNAAHISWKTYLEGINGKDCPIVDEGTGYAAKHNPMVFFDDVTDTNTLQSVNCIAHNRPYTELAADLQNNTVPRYNFIVPDLCDDMHDSGGCKTPDSIRNGDTWLASEVPPILNSAVYKQGGVLIITWDESEGGNVPIGLIVLASNVKPGYSNTIPYTHSSTLRTVEELFNVTPLLGDAAKATDLSDLFKVFLTQSRNIDKP